MTSMLKTTAALLCLSFTACGATATMVNRDSLGGQVQLQGGYMPAMFEAHTLIGEHCGGHADIVEHGQRLDFRCRPDVGSLALNQPRR